MKVSVLEGFARHGVRLTVLLVFLPGMAGVSQAQAAGAAAQPATKAAAPAAPAATPEKAAPGERQPNGNHEGIAIHGHWIIEVKNPDGTVTARREFENSLVTPTTFPGANLTGSQALVALLSGNATVSRNQVLTELWGIQLSSLNSGDASPCEQASLLDAAVFGITGIPGASGSNNSCELAVVTVTPPLGTTLASGNPTSWTSTLPSQLTIAATGQATQQGTIDTVYTLISLGNFVFPFTSLSLGVPATTTTAATPPVVPVGVNQLISVTVTISFQ